MAKSLVLGDRWVRILVPSLPFISCVAKLLTSPGLSFLVYKIGITWDFSGSPVVKTLCFHCEGCGFNP